MRLHYEMHIANTEISKKYLESNLHASIVSATISIFDHQALLKCDIRLEWCF